MTKLITKEMQEQAESVAKRMVKLKMSTDYLKLRDKLLKEMVQAKIDEQNLTRKEVLAQLSGN